MSNPNSNTRPRRFRFQSNPAIRNSETSITEVELSPFDDGKSHSRHSRQLNGNKIAGLNTLPGLLINATEHSACYTVDEKVRKNTKALNGEDIFQPYLYLFSVLIAFEWQPSPTTELRVRIAAKKASDFLYDVTDGFMAIGQVILGGHDLIDVADFQVMASNRFHPRSWISALHEEHKYQPIRVGRGLWRKDQGFVVSWDESDSHRVLVHEWGHYALELVDEYLDLVHLDRTRGTQRQWQGTPAEDVSPSQRNSLEIVAPSVAPPIDSIMSTLASSELIPRHGPHVKKQREYMQGKIQNHFPMVALKDPLEGPTELPLPELPIFRSSNLDRAPEEVQLSDADMKNLHDLLVPPAAQNINNLEMPGSPWVYVLKTSAKTEEERNRIIGQGVFGERDWDDGFALLGTTAGDQVVVVAQVADKEAKSSQTKVVLGELVESRSGQVQWRLVTPQKPPDFVDVLPAEKRPVRQDTRPQLPTNLRVQIEARTLPSEVWISAVGQTSTRLADAPGRPATTTASYPDGATRKRWVSDSVPLNHLDGHVLLRWDDGAMYICGYSHGGGPCSGGGGRCVCYTAGSYEGNSMLFYRDNYDASDTDMPQLNAVQLDDEGTRIVSTVMHGGQQYINLSSGDLAEARSYIFSLGANQPLNTHSATLVLYYDDAARKRDGDLLIYRWIESTGWERLTTYAPTNQPYLSIPLDAEISETRGSTTGTADEYFDRYRIYWTPS